MRTHRQHILARRSRFILAGIASVTIGAASGCGAKVCLEPTYNPPDVREDNAIADSNKDADSQPQVCLSPIEPDTGPTPCLEAPLPDAGKDAEPQICLSAPLPDASDSG